MNMQSVSKFAVLLLAAGSAGLLAGCFESGGVNPSSGKGSTSAGGGTVTSPAITTAGGAVTDPEALPPGSISSSVANVNNTFYRIQNALTLPQPNPTATPNTSLVSYLAKNFRTAAGQQTSNLSTTSNPLTASGVGSIPLLAFAACTDVNPTSYGVTGTLTGAPTTAQSSAITAAGVTIVNQCTANLAAAGTPLNTQVTAVFNNQLATNPSGTTATQAFVAVCTAATSFCVSMTGF